MLKVPQQFYQFYAYDDGQLYGQNRVIHSPKYRLFLLFSPTHVFAFVFILAVLLRDCDHLFSSLIQSISILKAGKCSAQCDPFP